MEVNTNALVEIIPLPPSAIAPTCPQGGPVVGGLPGKETARTH
ncbi:MAG: hypothetical protein AVDCRST_MAG56-3654 [uncultured Cytophagales bacterium]|uniref:Uncharacterized protein n=1 Tax=uncultured Cytophagales bacterium TaxID=158755 RepID=A0A6J4JKA2_9SPHI|nr:MAG: hypothetical protein AVDCRST_MAG56-3654 [uncultured Cytophagales bacterium]